MPAIVGLLLTPAVGSIFWFTDLDLHLQRLVYSPTEPHWLYADRQPWIFLHDYATWPGLILAILAIIALAISFTRESARRWRYPALFIFLFMAIGSGLVTNLLGKAFYGRPRPYEIVQFGGSLPFHRAFELGQPGKGFSFLCGHCSMGYLFFAFFFLCRGVKRWIALAGSAVFGLIIGIGRVVQAAHFPSDILLDGTLMFTVAAALSPIATLAPRRGALPRWRVVAVSSIVVVMTVAAFLFSTPVQKEWSFLWIRQGERRQPATRQEIYLWREPKEISFSVTKGDINVVILPQNEPLVIETLVKGFGFPGASSENTIDELQGRRILSFENRLTGLFWEVHGHFRVSLAETTNARLFVRTGDGNVRLHASGLRRVGNHYVTAGQGHIFVVGNPVIK
jgi:membrane-associated PAP2 superfamily phosphatase